MDLTEILGVGNCSIYDETVKEWLENRVLIINQDISDDILESYIMHILKWNAEDKHKDADARKPIRIIINSSGGDMIVGMGLVDAILQSETKIIGIGLGLVASAAFHIYISCHERVSFKNTVFLMHDGEINIQQTTSKARDTMAFFEEMEDRIKNHVLSYTEMTEEFYDGHFKQELYLYANTAKKLGCVDKIIGDDVDIDYILD